MDRSDDKTARLVLRAQCGDREALEALLVTVQGPLHRYLRTLLPGDLADDALQETFILICRKLKWLREPRCFRGWAFRIAGREAFRRLKAAKKTMEVPFDDSLNNKAASASATELNAEIALLDKSLALLPPAARAVVWLHYSGQMSISEVAGVLGIKVGTAKSRLSYGVKNLGSDIPDRFRCSDVESGGVPGVSTPVPRHRSAPVRRLARLMLCLSWALPCHLNPRLAPCKILRNNNHLG